MRSLPSNSLRAVFGAALLMTGIACADKAFTPPAKSIVNPRMKLMVMATSAQQVAPSAKYVWVAAAAIIPGGDTGLLAMMSVPATGGTQNITLDVDISRCVAATAAKGSSGCSIVVAAALRADSIAPSDTSDGDPFARAFDYVIVGPFDVSTGRAPTIPNIDLSVSRFSIFDWAQDDALRLGAGQNVVIGSGSLGRVLAGTASGTASPVLYSTSWSIDYATFNPNQGGQFTAYPALAIFENGSWRRVLATTAPPVNTGASSSQGFQDVTALATNDVYVAATSGLWKFDGAAFTKVSAVTDSLYSVASASTAGGKVVIAGGTGGIVWIGYGTTWQRYNTGSNSRFDGVCITGPSEAFAASNNSGALYRFNGSTWTSVPTVFTGPKYDLQCPSPGVAFVSVGGSGYFRWNASGSWTQLTSAGLNPARASRMAAASATELYVVGDSANTDRAFYRGDGTSWSEIGRRRFAISPTRVWADPRGGAAYVLSNYGRLEKVTPSSTQVLSYQPAVHDVAMTSANSAFLVGTNVFLARWDGARWTIDTPPAGTPSTRVLQAVWSDGPSNAWAVGNGSTILRYSGSGWSVVSDVNKPIGPVDNYNGVWGSGNDIWVAGETTLLHCKAATSTCVVESSGATVLYSIWGSSTSNVFAVGTGGRILRYNGTSWSVMNSPATRTLARVSGSGANDVWAVGDSVLVHFDGTQWTNYPMTDDLRSAVSRVPSQLSGVFHLGLWVKGPKEAYVAGDAGIVVRWDGSGWRQMHNGTFFGRRVLAITGAAGCAIALAEGQTDAPAATLWRGIGVNGCMTSPMGAPTTWP